MKRTPDAITQRVSFAIPTLCAVTFCIAAAIGGLAQAAPAVAPVTAYRIAGTVVNAVTEEPVRRATVAVLSETNREVIESVVTDNEGRFSLEGLAAGKYPLTASKRGFLTGFFEEHDGGYNSAIVTGEGQETGDLVQICVRVGGIGALHQCEGVVEHLLGWISR